MSRDPSTWLLQPISVENPRVIGLFFGYSSSIIFPFITWLGSHSTPQVPPTPQVAMALRERDRSRAVKMLESTILRSFKWYRASSRTFLRLQRWDNGDHQNVEKMGKSWFGTYYGWSSRG